jgi:twitching motility protein PilT
VKLLDSLLDAIVRLEGDALVMHVGEKPYVVTASSAMNAYRGPLAWGQVELSSRVLTFDAVSSMLGQILPADQQQALTEFGAIEHEIPSPEGVADRFTVVAARGGEDVWVELRRRPIDNPPAEAPVGQTTAPAPSEQAASARLSQAAPSAEPVAAEARPADEHPIVAPAAGASAVPSAAVEPTPDVHLEQRERVEPAVEVEKAAPEIELAIGEPAQAHEQPAGEVELQSNESIVVAIPGLAAEEFALNAVPDNAIQIVDDEPQGLPTEEEVDAMLAATATALLTSGLAGEVVTDEEAMAPDDLESREAERLREGEAIEDETEIVLTTETMTVAVMLSEFVSEGEIEAPAEEPAWSLSPPPPVAGAEEQPEGEVEAVGEAPVGTPLFSEEAVLAAAPPPSAPVEPEPAVEMPPVAEQTPAELLPVGECGPDAGMSAVPELAPAVGHATTPEGPAVDETQPVAQAVPVAGQAPVEEPPTETPPTEEPPPEEPPTEEPPVEQPPAVEPPVEEPLVVEHVSIAAAHAATEISPVPEHAPIVEPASIAGEAALVEAVPSAEVPPFEPTSQESTAAAVAYPGSVVEEVRQTTAFVFVPAPATDELIPVEPPVETPMNVVNAGGVPATPESTSAPWMPPAPEMPMEVTPELRGQDEPVAEIAHWASASPESPTRESPQPVLSEEAYAQADDEARQAVVVPLARTPAKPESVAVPFTPSEDAALMHTLRAAAARGATTVYVVAQSKPMIRVDGEIGPLENEPTLTAADVDRLVLELAPPRRRDALQNGPVEWLCDVPQIGRVRCLTFRDHRGPGVLFRMFPPRAISADQLGLTSEVQALCQQSDGLVLVTGARASGKSTLLNAFVDLINRTRSDHVITIESQIGFVHESRRSFISQRESRGDVELAATFARAALHEDPDVMMIEDLKSADLVAVALEAAESGRLVLASVPASSTIGALERLIEVFPADRRAKARTSLATALRGVIAQVLLRRVTGGLVAAREILLNTPAVSQLVLEGKLFQLPVALDSGRRHGMVPLTDSLAAHVREGTVQVAEAYRKALDRAALVALLKREGIDTSFAERLV